MNATRPKPTANAGTFKPGLTPWNKGVHVSLSPATQFKKGQRSNRWVPVGTERQRRHKGDTLRWWVKVAEPNKWALRAVVAWERANNCALPKGYVVHHKDRDSLNDSPANLEALTRAQHIEVHRCHLKTTIGLAL